MPGVVRPVYLLLIATGCRYGFQIDGDARLTGDGAAGDGVGTDGTVDASFAPADAPNVIPIDAAPGTLAPIVIGDTYLKGTGTMANGTTTELRVGRDVGGSNDFGVLAFDVSMLPATPVTKATLRLYQYTSSGTGAFGVEVRRLTQAWDETAATWTKATATVNWTTAGGTFTSTIYSTTAVTPGAYGFYDLDVTTLVDEWVTGASPNDGLELVYANAPSVSTYATFASREHATAAYRPQLLITP